MAVMAPIRAGPLASALATMAGASAFLSGRSQKTKSGREPSGLHAVSRLAATIVVVVGGGGHPEAAAATLAAGRALFVCSGNREAARRDFPLLSRLN